MQLHDMAKRKRNIFTVRESVPNWFEASEGTPRSSEEGNDPATIYVTDEQAKGVANRDHIYVADGRVQKAANWDHTCVADEGITVAVGWDRPYVATSSINPQASVGGRVTIEGTGTNREAQPQPTLAAAAVEWLEAAKPPITGGSSLTKFTPGDNSNVERNHALNAFWSLLRDVGYEIWWDRQP